MKKILMMTIFGLILAINFQSVRAASLKDTPRLAILPYADKAAISAELSMKDPTIVSEFLIEQFLDSGRFKIVEREKLHEILAEHSLNASGLIDPLTAVAVGKLAGAQYLVAGSVTGLSTKESGISYSHSEKGGASFNKYAVVANITLRIIDLEDGTVVMAVSGTGESARTNMEFTLRKEVQNYFGIKSTSVSAGYSSGTGTSSGAGTSGTGTDYSSGVGTSGTGTDYSGVNETNINTTPKNEENSIINTTPGVEENSNIQEKSTVEEESDNEDDDFYDGEGGDGGDSDDTYSDDTYSGDGSTSGSVSASNTNIYDTGDVKVIEQKLTIGGMGFSLVQVRNALYKASVDAIYNKDYGLLAKIDGKAKRRKV